MRAVALPATNHEALEIARDVASAMRRHRLGTHAGAVAFRVLVALVPLGLLGIGLLGVFGLQSVWRDSISATLHRHLLPPIALALDDTAERIFRHDGVGLIALAIALVVWNTLRAVREIEHALDEIHELEGRRSARPAFAVGLLLAVAVDLCVVLATLTVVVPPRLVGPGPGEEALSAARWPAAAMLLWVAVTLLLRYAPGERPQFRWASAGSALVVFSWLCASALFGLWSEHVANYKTALGTLSAFLVLTTYVLVLAYVLILGGQVDETLRRRNGRRRR
jgi:membrane protein